MTEPRPLQRIVRRDVPVLKTDTRVADAIRALLACDLPALPVVDDRGRIAGVFGEREFIGAIFPGYVKTLSSAGFMSSALDDAIEKRKACAHEPVGKHMTEGHIEVGERFSDLQIAETFLHHRVLIVPLVDGGRVAGVITRHDFFRALAERWID